MPTPAENYMDVPHWEPEPKPSDSPERLGQAAALQDLWGRAKNPIVVKDAWELRGRRKGSQRRLPGGDINLVGRNMRSLLVKMDGKGNTGTEWPIEGEGSQAYAVWLEWRATVKAAEGGRTSDQ